MQNLPGSWVINLGKETLINFEDQVGVWSFGTLDIFASIYENANFISVSVRRIQIDLWRNDESKSLVSYRM